MNDQVFNLLDYRDNFVKKVEEGEYSLLEG